jgi:hypothetical protein
MLEQSTLMSNITLFENELKIAKLRSNIVQQKKWWWMCLPLITEGTTLQIDKHVRIRNFIEWESVTNTIRF